MKPADRKYLCFVIAAFVLLGLVGLGVYLYKPLRLKYAIYRVRRTDYGKQHNMPDEWLNICVDSACRGNRPAMEVVVDHAEITWLADWLEASEGQPLVCSVGFRAACAQPDRYH